MKRLLIMLTWGGVCKNLICFVLKERYTLRFQTNVYIFNIFVYIIVPLNILKNGPNYEVYFATRAKKWCYWRNVGHRLPFIYIITQGGGVVSQLHMFVDMGGRGGLETPQNSLRNIWKFPKLNTDQRWWNIKCKSILNCLSMV